MILIHLDSRTNDIILLCLVGTENSWSPYYTSTAFISIPLTSAHSLKTKIFQNTLYSLFEKDTEVRNTPLISLSRRRLNLEDSNYTIIVVQRGPCIFFNQRARSTFASKENPRVKKVERKFSTTKRKPFLVVWQWQIINQQDEYQECFLKVGRRCTDYYQAALPDRYSYTHIKLTIDTILLRAPLFCSCTAQIKTNNPSG